MFGRNKIFESSEIIAVGDIHGESLKLKKIIKKIKNFLLNKKCHVVFCGDYFDRGFDSPGVFEILREFKEEFFDQVHLIMGNHEQMIYETIFKKKPYWAKWTHETLNQFLNYWDQDLFFKKYSNLELDWFKLENLDIIEELAVKNKLLDFLENLIPYYENDFAICSHAPIDFNLLSPFNSDSESLEGFLDSVDLRWSFVEEKELIGHSFLNKYLICGHQADLKNNVPRVYNRRCFIDTGCGLKKDKPLTAFMYPSKIFIQEF